tara:strand:- start:4311 stop:5276 length:966 start_codon:yes stop_codon:yes gene_type:complete
MNLAIRIGLLAAIVVTVQVPLGWRRLPREVRELDERIERGLDVVQFADSVNASYAPSDTDTRSVAQMLDAVLEDRHVDAIHHAAYQPAVYLAYLENLRARGVTPKTVVVPINPHIFSPNWTMRPDWQFERERFALGHPRLASFVDPLMIFRAVSATEASMSAYVDAPVYEGRQVVGRLTSMAGPRSGDREGDQTARIFTCHYMAQVHRWMPRVSDLEAILACVESMGCELVVYITPIDVEEGERLLPGRFRNQVRANAEFLVRHFAGLGVTVHDFSAHCEHARFYWPVAPDEHLDEQGRAALAGWIADAIRTAKPVGAAGE